MACELHQWSSGTLSCTFWCPICVNNSAIQLLALKYIVTKINDLEGSSIWKICPCKLQMQQRPLHTSHTPPFQSFPKNQEVPLSKKSHSASPATALPAVKRLETSLLCNHLSQPPKLESLIAKFWFSGSCRRHFHLCPFPSDSLN